MRILHFGSVVENKASGLSFSIPNLIKSQNYDKKEEVAFLFNTKDGVLINMSELSQYNIIVLHSFFILGYIKIILKIPRGVKVIICPRGAFSKSNKYVLKKYIYSFLYFSILKLKRLNYSIHFLTNLEMERSRFRSKNDFVIGNCINIGPSKIEKDELLKDKFYKKNIVYIGRFSKSIKGLDLLFDLISENKSIIQSNDIIFDFYGPDSEDKHFLMEFVNKHVISNVFFHDEVYGDAKIKILSESSFHILNSRSEGFPMSVLESSMYYTPQLLSIGTNLQEEMIKENFGIPIDSSMFRKIVNLSFKEYEKMALNARNFAEKHSFAEIGRITNKLYQK